MWVGVYVCAWRINDAIAKSVCVDTTSIARRSPHKCTCVPHHTHTTDPDSPPSIDRSIDQVNAVREAFELVYPKTELQVEGVEVESGVSCQVRVRIGRDVDHRLTD